MKITGKPFSSPARTVVAAALLCLLASAACADVPGIILKKDKNQIRGMVRYLRASKKYVVVQQGGVQIEVPLRQVEQVRVKKPATIDALANAVVHGKKYKESMPALEKIVADYERLQWDRMAAPLLATAYLKTGDATKAATTCERLFAAYPDAMYTGETPRVYWDALLQTKQYSKLRKALGSAIEQGNRMLAATAQLVRGNLDMQQEKYKDALVDGYLRTIILYAKIREVQPEALYSAALCFKELGELSNAEKMRKKLLAEFPQDPYTEKIKGEL